MYLNVMEGSLVTEDGLRTKWRQPHSGTARSGPILQTGNERPIRSRGSRQCALLLSCCQRDLFFFQRRSLLSDGGFAR